MATSLVLPCYNPAPGWEQHVLESYRAFCARVEEQVQLVLVRDGSSAVVTDAHIALLSSNIPSFKLIAYDTNRGKGYALRKGIAEASGDIVMYTDIDFPYTLESMQTVYDKLNKDECDVAIGVKNEAYYAQVPWMRRAISKNLRLLTGMFLSMPITDTQCGLKGFNRKLVPVFLATTIDRYLFDLEFVRNCFVGKKYRVNAVPVALNENVHFRSMNYRILLPEMANFIRLLFRKSH